jgi:hypothetical protein
MTNPDNLPPGPFFDTIREWNKMVDENREKFPGLPEGCIPVSPFFMKVWNEEKQRLRDYTIPACLRG